MTKEAKMEMSNTLLDNWKGSNLEGLKKRSGQITSELSLLEHRKRNLKDEMKVIWYLIGKREALI